MKDEAAADRTSPWTVAKWKIIPNGDKATAIDASQTGAVATQIELRRTNQGWMIDSLFSDEMILQISSAFSGIKQSSVEVTSPSSTDSVSPQNKVSNVPFVLGKSQFAGKDKIEIQSITSSGNGLEVERPKPSASEYRGELREAQQRVDQVSKSVQNWKERIQQYKDHPDGSVDGKDIPNSDSIEDAQDSLNLIEKQLVEVTRDQRFLQQQFNSYLEILKQQHEVTVKTANLARTEANQSESMWKNGAATKTVVTRAELKADQAELELTKSKLLLEAYLNVAEEFNVSPGPLSRRSPN